MKKCSLCGSENNKIIHMGVRDNPNIDVLRCQNCGLVFLSDMSQITDNFYQDGGMHTEQDDAEIFTKWRENTYADDLRRASMISANGGASRSILDFGSGNGGFLNILKENGFRNLSGVELERYAREKINAEGIDCREDIDQFDMQYFDVITSFHVIEHLTEPSKWLSKIRSHMDDGSQFYVETPNADDALLNLYHCDAFADFTYWSCHVFLYTVRTLQKLLENNGFEVVESHQVQRYPLANHLYWLSQGKPGGQNQWHFFDDEEMNSRYAAELAEQGQCDTILLVCRKAK